MRGLSVVFGRCARAVWRLLCLRRAAGPVSSVVVAALVGVQAAPPPAHAQDAPTALPAPVRQALDRAQLPPSALSVYVHDVDAAAPRLAHNAQRPVNPASLFKLATTLAALELLGPQFTWTTSVWLDGTLRRGVLDGALVIKGGGDPKLTVERIWLLLRRVQAAGLREIRGDIVLDRSAFARAEGSPADFDGEPLRPYNVAADALLLAQRSLIYTFTPDLARGVARVAVEPTLDGHAVDAELPLSGAPCGDWRAALAATPADPQRMRFAGRYPAACGERSWPLAYADPASFDARLLGAMWRAIGGTLRGAVREGSAPATPPAFMLASPPLADVVRDINKYSNNTMAQQVFLTLGLQQRGSGSPEAARAVLRDWLAQALGGGDDAAATAGDAAPEVDNGSGLSRSTRLSAEQIGRLLLRGWRSPWMPELLASLPVVGLDGTARRSRGAVGRAHLKTGSLRDVLGIAGVVDSAQGNGRRTVLVALLQHDRAAQGREVLDALQQWLAQPATTHGAIAP